MKHSLCLILILALLLVGCKAAHTGPSQPTGEPPATTAAPRPSADEQALLVGVWRNAGQYEEGRDFIETMALDEGGVCTVTLDYQGVEAYQTIEGVYTVEDGVLSVRFEDENGGYERVYRYELDGRTLVLDSGTKRAEYIRIS